VLRQGLIPPFAHGLLEYGAGVLLLVAPFLFGFDSDAATAISIVVGLAVLVLAASTAGPTGLAKVIPLGVPHVLLDLAVVAVLVASPFLFGFSGEGAPTAFFMVLGVWHLLLTIATRFKPAAAEPIR
jgi:SPW repeat-containing protein